MNYKLTRYEQETIITFNEDDARAELYTASPRMMRYYAKLAEKEPEQFKLKNQDEISVTYTCPREWLFRHVRPPRRISEAQKAANAANIVKARAAQSAYKIG